MNCETDGGTEESGFLMKGGILGAELNVALIKLGISYAPFLRFVASSVMLRCKKRLF